MEGERRRLTLTDPETGMVLSRGRSWLAAGLIVFGTSFMSLVVMALSPELPEVAAHFGRGHDGDLVSQLIQVMPAIGVIFGAPLSGWMVERAGPKRFLMAALTLFALAGSAGLYLDTIWSLVASRLILGVAASGVVTATLFMIGEYFDVEARTRILGYQSAVGAAGAMLIGQAAGLVATFGGWRAPFALYLVAIPVVGIVAYAVPSNRSTARRSLRAASESKEKSASILRLLPLLPLLALVVLLFIGSYMSNIHVSFLLDDDGVSTPALRSLPLSVSALMVAVGSACYGSVRLRLGDRWTLRLCGALLGIGVITMGIAPTGEVVALGCGIAGFGTGIANPQVNNMLISASDPSIRGRAIGFGYTARYLGNFLNPWIVRPIAFAAGMHNAFIIVGAMFVAGVLLDTATRRRRALAS